MKVSRDTIKSLIKFAPTLEEADKIIESCYGFKTVEEKIAFLQGLFDVEEVAHKHKDEATYYAMLNTIQKI